MQKTIVRIWDHDGYTTGGLEEIICCWDIPVLPVPGDYIEINGNQKRIATLKKIFKPKNDILLVEILIQWWENDRDLTISHFVPSKIENRENIKASIDWNEIK
jgi:hypothetical protein